MADNVELLRKQRHAYRSVRAAAEAFSNKAHAFVNPNAQPFPEVVEYPAHCPRGCCKTGMSRRDRAMLDGVIYI